LTWVPLELANRASRKIHAVDGRIGRRKLELKSIIMHHEVIERARLQTQILSSNQG
jgi:hypothetical protein